jgi:hypothetical protein
MKGVERFICAFDNHGDKADPSSVAAFFEFCKSFKPHHRIHGGDCFNLACLRKNASEGEKREKLQDDIDAGIDFIKRFKPTRFLRGNHDERLWDAANCDDGKLANFAAMLILDINDALGDAVMLPYNKRTGVAHLGKLRVIHGYHTGLYAARHAAAVYGNVLMGHVHAEDHQSLPHLDGVTGDSSGALCALDQDYNRGHAGTLRQSNGWAYGFVFASGDFLLMKARKVGGCWVIPDSFREVKA